MNETPQLQGAGANAGVSSASAWGAVLGLGLGALALMPFIMSTSFGKKKESEMTKEEKEKFGLVRLLLMVLEKLEASEASSIECSKRRNELVEENSTLFKESTKYKDALANAVQQLTEAGNQASILEADIAEHEATIVSLQAIVNERSLELANLRAATYAPKKLKRGARKSKVDEIPATPPVKS